MLRFCLSEIGAFWICLTIQVSQIQSPQYNTRGKLPPFPVVGSFSVYSELHRMQRRGSPLIKKCSKFFKPPRVAWLIGYTDSESSSGGGLPVGTIKLDKLLFYNILSSVYSRSSSCFNSDSWLYPSGPLRSTEDKEIVSFELLMFTVSKSKSLRTLLLTPSAFVISHSDSFIVKMLSDLSVSVMF